MNGPGLEVPEKGQSGLKIEQNQAFILGRAHGMELAV